MDISSTGALNQHFPRSPTDYTGQISCPPPASLLAWGTLYPEAAIHQERQLRCVLPQAGGWGLTLMTVSTLLVGSHGGMSSEAGCRAAWSASGDQRNFLGVQIPGSITTGQLSWETAWNLHFQGAFLVTRAQLGLAQLTSSRENTGQLLRGLERG